MRSLGWLLEHATRGELHFLRWLCQIFVAIGPAPGANGTSTRLCFEKGMVAVYAFCITPHSINRAIVHFYRRCHRDLFWWCKRFPCYGCNSSVSICGIYTNQDTLEHHPQPLPYVPPSISINHYGRKRNLGKSQRGTGLGGQVDTKDTPEI